MIFGMRITRDIQSLSDFKQNASKFVKQVQETKEPLVLTVNGKPAVVLQDPDSFQVMKDNTERLELNRILRKRLKRLDEGGPRKSAEEFFSEFTAKYGVSFE